MRENWHADAWSDLEDAIGTLLPVAERNGTILALEAHASVLWQLAGARPLGVRARDAIETASELAFSVVSFAEIA